MSKINILMQFKIKKVNLWFFKT